jgi:hypothetical protein
MKNNSFKCLRFSLSKKLEKKDSISTCGLLGAGICGVSGRKKDSTGRKI